MQRGESAPKRAMPAAPPPTAAEVGRATGPATMPDAAPSGTGGRAGPSLPLPRADGALATDEAAATRNWDEQFDAVVARLARLAGADLAAPGHALPPDAAPLTHAGVRECVAALEQLHMSLTHERARRHELELDLFDARTALAQARVQLVGSLRAERRSRSMALHDELTALPNRSIFGEWLDSAATQVDAESGRLAVLYLDLDGFKGVNDRHGHDVGDELLQIIAARLARALRAGDVVSRLGGDEFVCLLSDVPDRERLGHLACKLFDAVSAPVKIGAHELSVCPSIGVAMCPADGVTAQALLRNADAAMYRAKRHRSGYAFFDQVHDG